MSQSVPTPVLRQGVRGIRGKADIEQFEYLKNKKSFIDEIKSIFHNYLRALSFVGKMKNSRQKL